MIPHTSDNVVRNFHGDKIQGVLDKIFPNEDQQGMARANSTTPISSRPRSSTISNMLKSEQARINGYLLELDHPVAGKVLISGQPVTINGEVPSQAEMPPEHGQHTEEDPARGRLLVGGHRSAAARAARFSNHYPSKVLAAWRRHFDLL